MPLPNFQTRKELFELNSKDLILAKDIDFDYLARETERYNCKDIVNICKEASLIPLMKQTFDLNKLREQSAEERMKFQEELLQIPISMEDFKQSIQKIKPSSTLKYLKMFKLFEQNLGAL